MTENTDLLPPSKPAGTKKSMFSSLTLNDKEVQFRADSKKNVAHRKYYASDDERRRLIKEVNDAGFLLYEYYLTLAGRESTIELTDKDTAHHFGWTVSKAQKIRQNLTNAGWFAQKNYSYTSGRKGITYYIGKDQVKDRNAATTAFADRLYT